LLIRYLPVTHTAGLSYDVFNTNTLQWRILNKTDPGVYMAAPDRSYYSTPLVHDPGTKFEYGTNIDFLGWVIEAITGTTLEAYIDAHVLTPLGMKSTTPVFADGDEVLYVHHRGADGSLTANATIVPPLTLYPRGGGHFLVSTIDDYSQFLLALLNGGKLPTSETRILKPETVTEYLFTDFIPQLCSPDGIGDISVGIPALTNESTFQPDVKKGWSCGMMLNLEARGKGRSEGSGAWAGLGNIFFWLDPVKGKLGLIMSEIFPFMDKEVCHLFDALEREVYGHDAAATMGEEGSNFWVKE
jgi:methyl acetate hydrolase